MGIERGPRQEAAHRERLAAAQQAAQQRARERQQNQGSVRSNTFRPRTETKGGRRWSVILASTTIVLLVAWFALPPLLGGLFRALAEENPDLIRVGLIRGAVEDVIDGRPDTPAGTDPTPVEFLIEQGASRREITDNLAERELITDRLAFSYVLITEGIDDELRFGTHLLDRTMTPREVAETLRGEPTTGATGIGFILREGLRLEQIVALLQTLPFENLDINEFYALATDPPDDLRTKYEWLSVIPEGNSLEGFLGAGVFDVEPDTDARRMVELLLERWQASPQASLLEQAEEDGKDFYSAVVLGSIVQREAILDAERPLIAGVYQNRLDGVGEGNGLLNADPVLIYAKDLMQLRDTHISEWPLFRFWTLDGLGSAQDFELPPDLESYQVWHSRGLPKGPICTPGLSSLQAALNPDTTDGFIYFLAKGDGSNGHVFAHTYAEHLQNIEKYLGGGGSTPTPEPEPTDPPESAESAESPEATP